MDYGDSLWARLRVESNNKNMESKDKINLKVSHGLIISDAFLSTMISSCTHFQYAI